jgi:hypothetical protein
MNALKVLLEKLATKIYDQIAGTLPGDEEFTTTHVRRAVLKAARKRWGEAVTKTDVARAVRKIDRQRWGLTPSGLTPPSVKRFQELVRLFAREVYSPRLNGKALIIEIFAWLDHNPNRPEVEDAFERYIRALYRDAARELWFEFTGEKPGPDCPKVLANLPPSIRAMLRKELEPMLAEMRAEGLLPCGPMLAEMRAEGLLPGGGPAA